MVIDRILLSPLNPAWHGHFAHGGEKPLNLARMAVSLEKTGSMIPPTLWKLDRQDAGQEMKCGAQKGEETLNGRSSGFWFAAQRWRRNRCFNRLLACLETEAQSLA